MRLHTGTYVTAPSDFNVERRFEDGRLLVVTSEVFHGITPWDNHLILVPLPASELDITGRTYVARLPTEDEVLG